METMINNIYSDILELSNIKKQKEYWLGNNSEKISSYVEIMCRLFDDNDFDDFIDNKAYSHGVSREIIFELNKLRELLNNYEEKETDKEILKDPNWKLIVNQAKKVIVKWKQ